jgi:Pyruvate kinase
MNVDTDMQYAFTRAVAAHMFKNYDGVLKVDGELGNKKVYDPRSYLALAETRWPSASSRLRAICARVAEQCSRHERAAAPAHKTKIVATIGPASESPEMLVRLIRAGLNVARLNFSHGSPSKHAEVIRRIRDAARETGRRVAIMAIFRARNCGWEKSIRSRFNFWSARISR